MSANDMDFIDQQNKLSRLLGDSNTTSDDAWPLADRKFEINRGEYMFAKDSKSYLGYATGTVSSKQISLPSGFLGIHQLIVNDINLTGAREMPLSDWELFVNAGVDHYYFWVNTSGTRLIQFVTSGPNGQTYNLYFYKQPTTDLSVDGDKSPFRNRYRDASVYWAAGELLLQVGKTQLAGMYKGEYEKLVIEARDETERLVMGSLRSYPEIDNQYQYDKDIQGIGTLDDGWIN